MASFESFFQQTVRRIQRHDSTELAIALSSKLRETEDGDVATLRSWRPWELLLLVQWTLEHGIRGPQPVNPRVLAKMMNAFTRLGFENSRIHAEPIGRAMKWVRVIAHQEFWLQRPLTQQDLALALAVFGADRIQPRVARSFRQAAGLEADEFLHMAYALYAWLKQDRSRLAVGPQLMVRLGHSEQSAVAFFKLLSTEIGTTRAALASCPGHVADPRLQLTATSPLVRYPLVGIGNGFLSLSVAALAEAFRVVPFRIVRHGDAAAAQQLSAAYEQHVGEMLADAGVSALPERTLVKGFGLEERKCVDFLALEDDATVAVEVKAVELRPKARVNPTSEFMADSLEGTVVKGFLQIGSTAECVRAGVDALPVLNRANLLGLIVTFGDLYLGPTRGVWDEFACKAVEHLQGAPFTGIAPGRVAIASIRELSAVLRAVRSGSTTLGEFVARVAERDAQPASACVMVEMHLTAAEHAAELLPVHQRLVDGFLDDGRKRIASRAST